MPVIVILAVALAATLWIIERPTDASAMPRGPVATATAPMRPPVLDGPTIVSSINQARALMTEPALTRDSCLDAAAAIFAKAVSDGPASGYPTGLQPVCGTVAARAGWVVGPDAKGVQLTPATVMRAADGSAGVTSGSVKRIGLDLVARHPGAGPADYLLVWVVAT